MPMCVRSWGIHVVPPVLAAARTAFRTDRGTTCSVAGARRGAGNRPHGEPLNVTGGQAAGDRSRSSDPAVVVAAPVQTVSGAETRPSCVGKVSTWALLVTQAFRKRTASNSSTALYVPTLSYSAMFPYVILLVCEMISSRRARGSCVQPTDGICARRCWLDWMPLRPLCLWHGDPIRVAAKTTMWYYEGYRRCHRVGWSDRDMGASGCCTPWSSPLGSAVEGTGLAFWWPSVRRQLGLGTGSSCCWWLLKRAPRGVMLLVHGNLCEATKYCVKETVSPSYMYAYV